MSNISDFKCFTDFETFMLDFGNDYYFVINERNMLKSIKIIQTIELFNDYMIGYIEEEKIEDFYQIQYSLLSDLIKSGLRMTTHKG